MHPQTPRVRRGPSISFGERSGGHVSEGHVIRDSLVVSDLDIHRQTNCSSKRSLRQAGAPARLRLQRKAALLHPTREQIPQHVAEAGSPSLFVVTRAPDLAIAQVGAFLPALFQKLVA